MLPRAVGGDRDRVAEQHGPGVGGQVLVRVEVLGDLDRLRVDAVPGSDRDVLISRVARSVANGKRFISAGFVQSLCRTFFF